MSGAHEARAMVLAAGLGTRLRPLTENMPKAMVVVGGRPLIDYAIDTVARAGIDRVVVNLHHHGDMIREHLGDGSARGLHIDYSEEDPLQGSGGGIAQARALLGESTVITLNADTIVEVDLGLVLDAHRARAAVATMVLRKDPQMERFGLIRLEEDDRVGAFLDTRRRGAPQRLDAFMYTGVQVLEPRVFDYMPADGPFSITAVTYPQMMLADEPIYGFRFDGTFVTVGTAAELEAAERSLRGASFDRTP